MPRQLSIAQKLKAISGVHVGRGGIASYDSSDIILWCQQIGDKNDTTLLNDSAVERINTLYHAHFED